ncbi:MAG: glycoside hydrolase family 2 TIM barrel-domain containing protein [Bacteroidota bacterium]|nr:glycoside hydrolase family 2 TIM barrel-domain containing protein [Bacteroidota bacterium]
MMRKSFVLLLSLMIMALAGFAQTNPTGSGRETRLFNDNWKFFKGDPQDAFQPTFNDQGWGTVDLPHDWSVEGPFDSKWASATAFLPTGTGWYRKTFTVPVTSKDKKVYIYFEGVSKNGEVWINGHNLGKRPNGYISYQYDMTPWLNFGKSNVLAVKVDHKEFADSRWYAGSGINRNVFLITTGKLHIKQWGIFATTPKVSKEKADVAVNVTVENNSTSDASVEVQNTLADQKGQTVARSVKTVSVSASGENTLDVLMSVGNPELWSTDRPNLYTLTTVVKKGNATLDQIVTKVGIRDFHFDANTGFTLNGVSMKLKGVCVHDDAGCLGVAVPTGVWERRLIRLKEMGCNSIRMSHNPHATELYDLCDKLGFLVMDEAFDEWEGGKNKWVEGWNVGKPSNDGYHEYFAEWHERDLRDQILKNRNHPSIIMWSIGNEIDYPNDPYSHPILNVGTNPQIFGRGYHPEMPNSDRLGVVSKELVKIVKQYDVTRPVTAALAGVIISNETGYADALDIAGYNYQEYRYADDHKKYPNRIIYGSENGFGKSAWDDVAKNDFISAQYLWTGIEYLGEANRFPAKHSTSGLLDLAGLKKPEYFFRQSLWSDKPMVYIGTAPVPRNNGDGSIWSQKKADPLWNYAKDEKVRISCFTNCKTVELFLNDKSLGVKNRADFEKSGVIYWDIPFEPGTLKAIAKDAKNKEVVDMLKTAAQASAITASADAKQLSITKHGLAHIELTITDKNGIPVFLSHPEITCTINGAAKLLGLENSNPVDTTQYKINKRSAFKGKLVAYIQTADKTGPVTLTFSSPDLKPANVVLQIIK